jgi:hypothetical protein
MARSDMTLTVRVADVEQWKAVVQAAGPWLENYGEVDDYGDGEKGCTQLDHGDGEYMARIALIEALRSLADAHIRLAETDPREWGY